jgi:hypothetical protein
MPLYKVLVPIDLLIRVTRVPIRDQRLPPLFLIALLLSLGTRRTLIVYGGIKRVRNGIGGAYKLGESGVDVGREL